MKHVNPALFADAQAYTARWTNLFNRVPKPLVLAIMKEESDYSPTGENHDERAQLRGGAYGLMGITADTADGLYKELVKKTYPAPYADAVTALLRQYAASREHALLDPNVNTLFGVYYLNKLSEMFHNDAVLVVAAYHAGEGTVKRLAQAGKDVEANVGPHTRQYLSAVLAAKKELEEYA